MSGCRIRAGLSGQTWLQIQHSGAGEDRDKNQQAENEPISQRSKHMKSTRSRFQVVTTFAVLVFLHVGNANAQTAVIRKDHLNKTRNLISKIPAQHQKLLSSGMQRILQLAQALNDDHSQMAGNGG